MNESTCLIFKSYYKDHWPKKGRPKIHKHDIPRTNRIVVARRDTCLNTRNKDNYKSFRNLPFSQHVIKNPNFVTSKIMDILDWVFWNLPCIQKVIDIFLPLIFRPSRLVVLRENNFSTLTWLPGIGILLITTTVYHTSSCIYI